MFMLFATNVLVGLLTWIALRWIGPENAGAGAMAAGLLHIIPYFGPAVTAAGIGMAAFMQFDSLSTVLLVTGTSLAIPTLVGTFVTTWMTGRIRASPRRRVLHRKLVHTTTPSQMQRSRERLL